MRKKYNMINDRSYLLFYLGEKKFSLFFYPRMNIIGPCYTLKSWMEFETNSNEKKANTVWVLEYIN